MYLWSLIISQNRYLITSQKIIVLHLNDNLWHETLSFLLAASVGLIGSSRSPSLFCVIGDVGNFQSCFVSSLFLRKTNYWAGVSCRPLSNFHQLSRPPGAFQQDEWCITWHFHPSGSQNRSFHSMLKKSEKVPFFIRILHHHQKLKSIVKDIVFFSRTKSKWQKLLFFATLW